MQAKANAVCKLKHLFNFPMKLHLMSCLTPGCATDICLMSLGCLHSSCICLLAVDWQNQNQMTNTQNQLNWKINSRMPGPLRLHQRPP